MAKWQVTCICEKCGKEFSRTGFAGNRADADKREDWVKKNPGLCRDCWKEEKAAEEDEFIRSLPLPELTGTEKQVKYAEDLRKRYLVSYCSREDVEKLVGKGTADDYAKVKAIAEAHPEKTKGNHLITIVTCLWETEAGYLISLLK